MSHPASKAPRLSANLYVPVLVTLLSYIIDVYMYFMLNRTAYLNNRLSAAPQLGAGEGYHALQCRTNRDEL